MSNQKEKPLAWLGSSKKDLMVLPVRVRIDIIRERLKVAEKFSQEMRDE